MDTQTNNHRTLATCACMAFMLAMFAVPTSAGATGNATYELRPHCENDNELQNQFGGPLPDSEHLTALTDGQCRSYSVRDPQSLQTDLLNKGDMLDMDLIIHNPDKKPISRFRAWIAYDATALTGLDVTLGDAFPAPTPGENVFSQDGYIKVSGSSTRPVSDEKIVVARIRMQVAQPRFDNAPLTYFDLSDNAESKTGIFETAGASESNVLTANPGYLFVRFKMDGTTASASSMPAGTTQSSAASSVAQTPTSTVFAMLQVQGVRVTTEGSSVFLAWDALPSSDLVGYNVYYGTTSGKYIQRRGVEQSATSLTIRALPVGTTYYFAIRGVNGAGQETEFSQEVGVSVGNPRTSTSPLNANSIPGKTPGTNGTVSGETGVSSVLLIFLTACAVIGTTLAFRRQMAVSKA